MSYRDVRGWIKEVQAMGELKTIEGADWNLEIGALSVLASKHKENTPALLVRQRQRLSERLPHFSGIFREPPALRSNHQSSSGHHARGIHPGMAGTIGKASFDSTGGGEIRTDSRKCLRSKR